MCCSSVLLSRKSDSQKRVSIFALLPAISSACSRLRAALSLWRSHSAKRSYSSRVLPRFCNLLRCWDNCSATFSLSSGLQYSAILCRCCERCICAVLSSIRSRRIIKRCLCFALWWVEGSSSASFLYYAILSRCRELLSFCWSDVKLFRHSFVLSNVLLRTSAQAFALPPLIRTLCFSRLISLCFDVSLSLRCVDLTLCTSLRSSSVMRVLAAPFVGLNGITCDAVVCYAFWSIFSLVVAVAADGMRDCIHIMKP